MVQQYTSRIIIYSIIKNTKYYLLLKDSYDKWNFFRSRISSSEITTNELKNEIKNKLKIQKYEFIPGFLRTKKFVFTFEADLITKIISWYLLFTAKKKFTLESNYEWFVLSRAYQKLENLYEKDILQEADKFLDIPRLL